MTSNIKNQRTNVAIITGDPLGAKMAGPGIRAVNFAEQISKYCNVKLVTTNSANLSSKLFVVGAVRNSSEMRVLEEWSDVLVIQGNILLDFPFLKKTKKYLVCDLYDPMQLEQLEQGRDVEFSKWNTKIAHANYIMRTQLEVGDFFLAATERQRDFWLGSLATLGRINAGTYDSDNNLNNLIAVVPFGIPDQDPVFSQELLRVSSRGIQPKDKVILWAGGIYNWFDPLSLVKAVYLLTQKHKNVKLFFMGTQHPHPGIPEMEILTKTRELAKSFGLYGQNVVFNDSWVKYADRKEYLLSADAGVSTHFEHLETRFSFRTRILDYLWAQLPIVTTTGDFFAEMVKKYDLGIVVPENNPKLLSQALEKVLFDEDFASKCVKNIKTYRKTLFWSNTVKPLVAYCMSPYYSADLSIKNRHGILERLKLPPTRGGLLFLRSKLYVLSINFKQKGLNGVYSLIAKKLPFGKKKAS